MGKRFVRCLAVAAFAALVTITWVTGAAAQVTFISACGTLSTFGQTYRLTADLVPAVCGNCLEVTANRVTVDGQGHKISQAWSCTGGAGVTDLGSARDLITVKNLEISDSTTSDKFDYGINLGASTRTEVRNVNSHHNNIDGIRVGNQSLVLGVPEVMPKTCRAEFNGANGITGGNRVQVQNCEARNNTNGIKVGDHCLITRNIANNNGAAGGDNGIETGGFCTVSFNTANNNFRPPDMGVRIYAPPGAW